MSAMVGNRVAWLLQSALGRLRARPGCSGIERMSAAAYLHETDTVLALAQAGRRIDFFDDYDFQLSDMPGLSLTASSGRARVVDCGSALPAGAPMHSRMLVYAGMRAGLTLPLSNDGELAGFLFLNACEPGYFSPRIQSDLAPFLGELSGHLVREFNREIEALTLISSRV